jgi:hypothetical protein
MTRAHPSLIQTAKRVLATLQRETAVARLGALTDFTAAAEAKRAALADFTAACEARDPRAPALAVEREVLRQVLAAADENALVLAAVRQAVEDLPRRLRAAVTAAIDPGTYSLYGRGARHVLAARINASA